MASASCVAVNPEACTSPTSVSSTFPSGRTRRFCWLFSGWYRYVTSIESPGWIAYSLCCGAGAGVTKPDGPCGSLTAQPARTAPITSADANPITARQLCLLINFLLAISLLRSTHTTQAQCHSGGAQRNAAQPASIEDERRHRGYHSARV